jgi:hypothetical protein
MLAPSVRYPGPWDPPSHGRLPTPPDARQQHKPGDKSPQPRRTLHAGPFRSATRSASPTHWGRYPGPRDPPSLGRLPTPPDARRQHKLCDPSPRPHRTLRAGPCQSATRSAPPYLWGAPRGQPLSRGDPLLPRWTGPRRACPLRATPAGRVTGPGRPVETPPEDTASDGPTTAATPRDTPLAATAWVPEPTCPTAPAPEDTASDAATATHSRDTPAALHRPATRRDAGAPEPVSDPAPLPS